jgi:hypothetical protein
VEGDDLARDGLSHADLLERDVVPARSQYEQQPFSRLEYAQANRLRHLGRKMRAYSSTAMIRWRKGRR